MIHNKYSLRIGETVTLDESHPNHSEVEILSFTHSEMFATVRATNSIKSDFWETMTNRLTPINKEEKK